MNKTILITGASKGLGMSILKEMLAEGYTIVAASRSNSTELQALIKAHPKQVVYHPLDLSNPEEIVPFCKELFKKYKFYGIVNNAGIAYDGLLIHNHLNDLVKMVNVNFVSPMILCQLFSKHLIPQRAGRIINISSIASTKTYKGLAAYGATKAALDNLTKSLAREIGSRGITVNSIAPGFIITDMNASLSEDQFETIRKRSALNRLPVPKDISNMVSYLLSDKAKNVTGSVMVVDSGQSL